MHRSLVLLLASLVPLACSLSLDPGDLLSKSASGSGDDAGSGAARDAAIAGDANRVDDGGAGADADGTAACGDLATDPKNCGACGHDCLGGGCAAGECQPIHISDVAGAIVAADASGLYATQAGAVLKLEKSASTAVVTLSSGMPSLFDLAFDVAMVYAAPYSSPAQLYRVPKSGGAFVQMMPWTSPQGSGVAVGGSSVYFATYEGAIMTVPTGATNTIPNVVVPAPQAGRPFTADATAVYWAKNGVISSFATTFGVAAQPLATAGDVSGLAIDAGAVYFVDRGAAIRRVAKSGGAADIVTTAKSAADLDADFGFVVDATNVYWVSRTAARVFRAPKSGGAYVALATVTTTANLSLTADDTSLFFCDGSGTYRLAK